ncbi:Uma2 family endonuclease [Spirulina major CS-329]|uniref:Uma2 family endonuclease n=1 Tax=Spirulina TaxID=1154 RepID=UPI00232FFA3B|nr:MULTISPECIES: Uma2 family endonuclease [Spirulina]MDB9495458.1 Uma2 family endonuclease [Spirulina subsalsa CS-330]MDB9502754.1 Uma2 family endonuclease [Spirulina major CS-329]
MTLSPSHFIPQSDPPRSASHLLPTMYDLPSEFPEEPGLPDVFHDLQPQLLSRTLQLANHNREHYFTASDLNLYYDPRHHLWHKRPDWFLALNVPALYEGRELRRSYVVWQEGQAPTIAVEFLSPSTEREDLGRFYTPADQAPESPSPFRENRSTPDKIEVYEKYLRVPHYFVGSALMHGTEENQATQLR